MTKLKGILLTEGMHGMISQVEGLAKALDLEFIHEKIELNKFWKLIPPSLTPIKKFVFENNIDKDFNIVISCGRKSVIPSIYLKKKYKNKIMNIHIQDPKVSLNNFDYIVAPEHDQINGKNVLTTKGAIHYLRNNELNAPIVIGRDHLDCGSVASPNRETESMLDGSDAVGDWPLLNALLNTASGASWVSFHHGGGVGMGYSLHAGQVIVADGTEEMDLRINAVLTNDPGMGIYRHADAGYESAIKNAEKWNMNIPMKKS